jgi:hypothetical protein
MPNIDVSISADLQGFLEIPSCDALKLPNPKPLKLTLPGGATLSAFSDLSKGIPTDCSMTFSLLLQVAPYLASIECLIKLLKLVKPLIDFVQAVPSLNPKKISDAVGEVLPAAGDVLGCLTSFTTPTLLISFASDLLCLLIRVLNCLLGQLKSLANILGGITLKINEAQAAGNVELLQTLQCAHDNALIQAGQMAASFEPIGVILDLAGALLSIAKVPPITLPSLGATTDVESLNQVIQTLQRVVKTLEDAAAPLGGCQ